MHACNLVLRYVHMCLIDMHLQLLLNGLRSPERHGLGKGAPVINYSSAWTSRRNVCRGCCSAEAAMSGCCRPSWRRSSRQRVLVLRLKQRALRWQSCRAPCTARRAQMRPSIAWWSCCTSQRWVYDVSLLQAPFPYASGLLLPAMEASKARPLQQYRTGNSVAWD